jgi:NADPH:quinone reductase-like Zn-dependent oxidoreductase
VAAVAVVAPFSSQRMAVADIVGYQDKQGLLVALTALIESGRVRPVIDRRYAFDDIPEAVRYQEGGHASGKVVVSF